MVIIILGFLFTGAFGFAKDAPTEVSVNLSFYSKDNQTGMELYNTDTGAHKALSVGTKTAYLTFLDDEHIRFELKYPIHLELSWNDGTSAETVFKSVVVKIPPEDVASARALLGNHYLSFERNVPERINTFLEQSDGGQYDELIRRYMSSEYPPSIQQFVGFSLHIIVEEIGMPDGSHTKQLSVVSRVISRLDWATPSSASDLKISAAHNVQTIMNENDPHIIEYLRRLRIMNGREQELEYRGWLAPIKKRLEASDFEIVSTENVIAFPQRMNSCQNIFTGSP